MSKMEEEPLVDYAQALLKVVFEVRELHAKTYPSAADAVHETNPECDECGTSWPCATVRILASREGL